MAIEDYPVVSGATGGRTSEGEDYREPEGFLEGPSARNPFGDESDIYGLTPIQAEAVRRFTEQTGRPPTGEEVARLGVDNLMSTIPEQTAQLRNLGDRYLRGYMDRGSYTMGTLERDYPDMYRRPEDVTTGDIDPYMERVSTGDINPYLERVQTRGIDQRDISRFQDPFQRQVVSGALAEFDEGVDRASNMRRARQAGAGAFGSRTDLANQQVDADIARQRGTLAGNLLSQGYGQALGTAVKQAGIGQQADIRDQATMLAGGRDQLGRDLSAQQLNQAMRLRGGENQLARELRASQDRARNEMARTQFDVGAAYRGDQQRLGAIDRRQALERDIANLANMGATGGINYANYGLGRDAFTGGMFGNLFDFGTAQFTQPRDVLALRQPEFGGLRDYEEQFEERQTGTEFGGGFG
tara:strand:- start:4309 stop:5544 length:1236 start_codon:yes stop_codon:yes gene_type:complete